MVRLSWTSRLAQAGITASGRLWFKRWTFHKLNLLYKACANHKCIRIKFGSAEVRRANQQARFCWFGSALIRIRFGSWKGRRLKRALHAQKQYLECNRPYRLFTFDPMASFPCLPVLARQACAWRLHLMFPARICCFLILSPITNLSLNILCTKHEDWCHTKTRLLGQKWINGKVYW